ncbi:MULTISPECIES: sensor histidine kinase [Actinomadura]|uniref:sensor histidine kinase n=1 Tax=Actinomadura TaxID=1988 RepID=UPI00047A0818|nr:MULTISPECIES: histidine kinase [Actinomadura]RSN46642.1 two-component sensor histidine kinase [Actinomadura sp. WAC 06369]
MITLRRAPDLWHRLDVTVRDTPLALFLAVGSAVPMFQGQGTQLGAVPDRPLDALAAAAIALQSLPLVVRRRWTAVCLALTAIGFAIDQLSGYHTFAGTGMAVALLSAGAHLEWHRRTTALLLTAAYVPLAVALHRLAPSVGVAEFVTFYMATCFAWGVGAWLRYIRAVEAERRRHVAAATRAAERTRIARELHDVVTHHVTAMVVQAEAARYLTAAPERLDETLGSVTDTGRRAISDLRHLLDLLNPDHDEPAKPAVGELQTLVEQTRRAGQPVEFTEEGAGGAGSADFTIYRVVQESLTNALKYAHGNPTVVKVNYGEKEITVEVGTRGPSTAAGSPGGSGRGLAGLRERVDGLGGEFAAGPGPDGGFVVRARIPAASAP